jgi:SAM-dependent methyltransferase
MTVLNAADDVFQHVPAPSLETERWDREWINYFNTEDPRAYLLDYGRMKPLAGAIGRLGVVDADSMLDTVLFEGPTGAIAPLCIWASGADLVGKSVLEIGCGPGFLGKQLGLVAERYLGIDYSLLAVSIARLVSPPRCTYLHMSAFDRIRAHAGRFDTMVGRFFFIHQNFDNAIWLLRLANLLLRAGGVVCADFYQRDPAVPQGVVLPARTPLAKEHPSCGFEYTEADVVELAARTGFQVVATKRHLPMQRLLVRFRKSLET